MSMNLLLFLIFLANFTFLVGDKDIWHCADYYWRDYRGFVPHDAVPAGNDRQGNPRYIGLTYILSYAYLLLPATILPKEQTVQTTADTSILNTTERVQILCGPHLSAFEWIPIHSKDLHLYTSTRPVIPGGFEATEKLYIGRVSKDNDAIIGKVFRHDRPGGGEGLWFPLKGQPVHSITYELLVYNCQNVHEDIDVRAGFSRKNSSTTPISLVFY